MMGDFGKKSASKQEEDDEDDVPPLVQGTFEDASKGKKWASNEYNLDWDDVIPGPVDNFESLQVSAQLTALLEAISPLICDTHSYRILITCS